MKPQANSFRSYVVLSLTLLFFIPGLLIAQVPAFTLFFDNMQSFNFAHWSYDLDAPGFVHGDSSPYSWDAVNNIYHTYAYRNFGVGGTTILSCQLENLPFANVPADVTVEDYADFAIANFAKVNTVNPNGVWGVWGQSGETRTYVSDFYRLSCNGETLVLNNVQIDVWMPYPLQASMRANLAALGYPGANGWTGNLGSGGPATGKGRADINLGMSTANFVAALDNGNHQVEFDITTFDFQIQNFTGYYDMVIEVYPAPVAQNVAQPQVILANPFPQVLQAAAADITFDMLSAVGGGVNVDLNDLQVNEVMEIPDGVLPGGIAQFAGKHWVLGTTLGSFSCDLTFDMTGTPLGNAANWRILRRSNQYADWTVWNDFTLINANTIKANNVTGFSDWTVGSTELVTLPVQLSSFTAAATTQNNVSLQWVTQSETNLSGYYIFRHTTPELSEAINLNHLINATNSSETQTYTYVDNELDGEGTYYYWLQSLEINGESRFFGPVSTTLTGSGDNPPPPDGAQFASLMAYPNPFNPKTSVSFYLPNARTAEVKIINQKGQVVYTLPNQFYNPGWHRYPWNGLDNNGKKVSSGVYLVQLTGEELLLNTKILLLK